MRGDGAVAAGENRPLINNPTVEERALQPIQDCVHMLRTMLFFIFSSVLSSNYFSGAYRQTRMSYQNGIFNITNEDLGEIALQCMAFFKGGDRPYSKARDLPMCAPIHSFVGWSSYDDGAVVCGPARNSRIRAVAGQDASEAGIAWFIIAQLILSGALLLTLNYSSYRFSIEGRHDRLKTMAFAFTLLILLLANVFLPQVAVTSGWVSSVAMTDGCIAGCRDVLQLLYPVPGALFDCDNYEWNTKGYFLVEPDQLSPLSAGALSVLFLVVASHVAVDMARGFPGMARRASTNIMTLVGGWRNAIRSDDLVAAELGARNAPVNAG